MPHQRVPLRYDSFLRAPNPAVVATVAADGGLHTAATWYEWLGDDRILLNMHASRTRMSHLRGDPRLALTVLAAGNWYAHLSMTCLLVDLRPDPDLRDIDRISMCYEGTPYPDRDRVSWSATVEVQSWHSWGPVPEVDEPKGNPTR